MAIELMPLPFALDALEPCMSRETLEYHHGKHHKKYVTTLNELIKDTRYDEMELEEIVKRTYDDEDHRSIYNNAGQAWNHNFFWNCLAPVKDPNSPSSIPKPERGLLSLIEKSFGTFDDFKKKFSECAVKLFGSGWAWLVLDQDRLKIEGTSNANTPMAEGLHPVLTCDVWEHAYYIDYRNERPKFIENFWRVINWEFALEQVDSASHRRSASSSQQKELGP